MNTKIVKSALLATLVATASAHAAPYVSVNYLYNDLKFDKKDSYGKVIKDKEHGYRVAVGGENGILRHEVDYTNFGKLKQFVDFEIFDIDENEYWISSQQGGFDLKYNTQSVGITNYVDFKNQSKVTPYVGVRLAANRIENTKNGFFRVYESDGTEEGQLVGEGDIRHKNHKHTLGAGAVVGASLDVSPNVKAQAQAEYNHLGQNFDQYGANVGMRVQF